MSIRSSFTFTRLISALVPAVLLLAGAGLAQDEAADPATAAVEAAVEGKIEAAVDAKVEADVEVEVDAPVEAALEAPIEGEGAVAPGTQAPNASDPAASVTSPEVALARFTTAVENREPVDAIAFLSSEASEIVFFTDLRGLAGETVTHRWEFGGDVMAEVPFEVSSNRYRVWSRKALDPKWLGVWTVSVVKGDGEVLASESFTLQEG